MSSPAYSETSPQVKKRIRKLTRNLNSDFQFIADRLPTEIKESSPYDTFTLCALRGVGRLWAKYDGSRPDRTGRAISEYVMKIGVVVEGQDCSAEIVKEFGLTYQTLHREGSLDDLSPLGPEDLLGSPLSLGVIANAAARLRGEFANLHKASLQDTKNVIHLDARRD